MSPPSLLYPPGLGPGAHPGASSETLRDLNIDQVIQMVTAGREAFDLAAYFRRPLIDVDQVIHRQEVFRDLRRDDLRATVEAFATRLGKVRSLLAVASKTHFPRVRQRLFVEAAECYSVTVRELLSGLRAARPGAAALRDMTEHLTTLVESEPFTSVERDATALRTDLAGVRYNLLIRGATITVGHYDHEEDYSRRVLELFERFRQRDTSTPEPRPRASSEVDHVEAAVLDRVALLEPRLFARLAEFEQVHHHLMATAVTRYDQELQFYLSWLAFIELFEAAGLPVCLPVLSSTDKSEHAHATYDVALAARLVPHQLPVVNDFRLADGERVLVVSGPNQGGKTTFARTFGQLHYFASLGCPVAGSSVRLLLPDRVLTHFERPEQVDELSGKLEEELLRMRAVLQVASARSVLVLNELFSSTTVEDAGWLSRRVLSQVFELDALCVCVTFLDELSTLSDRTVSMVAGVHAHDPAVRTFKVERRPADGRAYATAIARRHRLTYGELVQRISS